MPNRVLRDWTDSETIDQLSEKAEVLFIRLMMKADDYGSYHGNLKLLKASLFPLRVTEIKDADIISWINECDKAGLIIRYEADGKAYLRIVNFGQRMRNMVKRFPDCPQHLLAAKNNPPQSAASCSEPPPETNRNETESEGETRDEQESPSQPALPDLKDSNLYRQPKIPTFEKVHELFIQQGGTKEMAEKFYQKHDATGWFLNNSPIVNIGGLIATYRSNWQKNSNGQVITETGRKNTNSFV